MTELQELREIVQAQAKRLTDTRACAQLNESRDEIMHDRIRKLENALADARRDHALLMRLVVRMGEDLRDLCVLYEHNLSAGQLAEYPYTPIGQRQRDAELREAEGPPPDAGMLESVQ